MRVFVGGSLPGVVRFLPDFIVLYQYINAEKRYGCQCVAV